jgi:hypothetical protein
MNARLASLSLLLVLTLGLSAATAQQRVEFERQRFDRSRFERAGPAAPQPPPPPAPAEPAPAEPAAPPPGREFSFPAAEPSESAPAPAAAPAETAAPPTLDNLPAKWFNSAKDHDELLEIQKQTGACMLVYFKNINVSNEKGLCSWFERGITTDMQWRKAMRYYLKLEVTLPGNPAARDLADTYRVNKTPALFVVQPGSSRPARLSVFRFEPGPVLEEIDTVIAALKARSTEAYQSLF